MHTKQFRVRDATAHDLTALAAIEMQAWKHLDMRPLTLADFERWLDTRSPFFLVAEYDNAVVGYYFGQCNDFEWSKVDDYTKFDIFTGKGYINVAHDPKGNSLYGVSVSSIMRGAGSALYREVLSRLIPLKKKYYFGYSRLSRLGSFIENLNPDPRKYAEENLDETALWYAHACMALIEGKVWAVCPRKPALLLPRVTIPDPVLTYHVRSCEGRFGLVRVVHGLMQDPASLCYAAFLIYEYR